LNSITGNGARRGSQNDDRLFPFTAVDGEGPIAKYLEKRGGGIHHLCFRTNDIDADVARLKSKGYQFLSDAPTPGAHGARVIFIHPKSCDGVLVELSQPQEDH